MGYVAQRVELIEPRRWLELEGAESTPAEGAV